MLLDPDTAAAVAVAGAALGAVAAGVAVMTSLQLRRMRRAYAVLQIPGRARRDVVTILSEQAEEVAAVRAELAEIRYGVADSLRHVAVVRYDAFPDMGGRLSFSAALLDDAGDGLVLTSINGRTETRTYAKGIKGGQSEHQLSPEELQAIDRATRRAAAQR